METVQFKVAIWIISIMVMRIKLMKNLVAAFLSLFIFLASSYVSAESVCVDGGSISREQLNGRVSYSVFKDELKIVFYLDQKQGNYEISHSEFFYGVVGDVRSYDELVEAGYVLQLPMEFELEEDKLHSRIFVKKNFEPFAVILKLVKNSDCEKISYCPQDVVIKVSPSDIDYSSRNGEL